MKYGTALTINWKAGSSPGKVYVGVASLTERVRGIIFLNRYFPVAADWLFFLSLANPAMFQKFSGSLDLNGTAIGAVAVPNAAALAGLKFSIAWVTVDAGAPFGVEAISGPWQAEITN